MQLPYIKIVVLLAIGLLTTQGLAQRPQIVISPEYSRFLMIGVNNPLQVAVPGVPQDAIEVTASNGGQVRLQDNGRYYFNPPRPDTIDFYIAVEGQPYDTVRYIALEIPDPKIYIFNLNGGDIPRNRLLGQKIISAKVENFYFFVNYRVSRFTLSAVELTETGDTIRSITNPNSGELLDEQKKLIYDAPRGSDVTIYNVQVVGPDGVYRNLDTEVVFTIR